MHSDPDMTPYRVVVTEILHPFRKNGRDGYTAFIDDGETHSVASVLSERALAAGPDAVVVTREGRRVAFEDVVRPNDHLHVVYRALGKVGEFYLSLISPRRPGELPSLPPGAFGRSARDNTSQVYGWDQGTSDYNPFGLAIPVVYGETSYAGIVISKRVEVVDGDPPRSYLYVLLLLGSGPVDSIGGYSSDRDGLTGAALPAGMLINGNDARNFDEVTVSLRLGTQAQTVMAGFESIPREIAVELPLEQNAGTAIDPLAVDWSLAASSTMPPGVTADRATVTIRFPNGLYRIASSGAFKPNTLQYQIRYTRVNDAGDKVGSSVVLPSPSGSFEQRSNITEAFNVQTTFPMLDPETYVTPTQYGAWQLHAGVTSTAEFAQYHGSILNAASGYGQNQLPDALTVFCWARIVSVRTYSPVFSWANWNADPDPATAAVQGVFLVALNAGQGDGSSYLRAYCGQDLGGVIPPVALESDVEGDIAEGDWFSAALTYQRDYDGNGNHRYRLYLDGWLTDERISTRALRIADWIVTNVATEGNLARNVLPGQEGLGSVNFGHMEHDQLRLYSRALEPTEIIALHNGGVPQWGLSAPADRPADLLLASLNDLLVGVNVTGHPDLVGTNLDRWRVYEGSTAVTPEFVAGITDKDVGNEVRRDRYIVEIQRTNADDDNNKKKSEGQFHSMIAWLDSSVAYTGCALAGVRILATDQLSQTRPNIEFVVKGRNDIPVWDGASSDSPTFNYGYSANPAWQLAHYLLSEDAGGHVFDDARRIVWEDFQEWAAFCDEKVYDQRGKYPVSELEYDDTTPGDHRVLVTAAKPLPSRFEVGGEVRLSKRTPGAYMFPGGGLTILGIDESDPDVYVLSCGWPGGEPLNLLSQPNTLSGGSWSTGGSAPTISSGAWGDSVGAQGYMPHAYRANIMDSVTFQGGGESTFTQALTGLTAGASYRVSCYAFITDGLAAGAEEGKPWIARFKLGANFADVTIPDGNDEDSQGTKVPVRVSAVIQAPAASSTFAFGNFDDPDNRVVAVGGFMVHAGETVEPYDEVPTAGAGNYPDPDIQKLPNPLDLTDETDWVRTGDIAPILLASETVDLPTTLLPSEDAYDFRIGFAGAKASAWQFPALTDGSSVLRATLPSGHVDNAICSVYAKVLDGGGTWRMRFFAASGNSAEVDVPDNGEWNRVGATAGSNPAGTLWDIQSRDTGASGVTRRIALVAPLATDSAAFNARVPFYGNPVAEVMGVEPRIECNLVLADRGIEFWEGARLIASVGRARIVRLGDAVSITVDRPRDPELAFNPSNIAVGSWSSRSAQADDAFNVAVGDIQDRDIQYARNTVPRQSRAVTPDTAKVSKSFDMRGVTNASQAVRELDVLLRRVELITDTCSFQAGPEAAFARIGSVAVIAHPAALWSDGARVDVDADTASEFVTDAAVVVQHINQIPYSGTFGDHYRTGAGAEPWVATHATASAPTITANPVPDPENNLLAWEVTFPDAPSGNTRLDAFFDLRWQVEQTCTVWLRRTAGPDDLINVQFVKNGQVMAQTASASISSTWARYSLTGTPSAGPTNVKQILRFIRSNSSGGAITLEIAWPTCIVGTDDGHPGNAERVTGALLPSYVAVRDSQSDELFTARTRQAAGAIAAGGTVELAGELGYQPRAGDVFLVGPMRTSARTFELEGARLQQDMTRELTFAQYDDDVYADEDEFPTLAETFGAEIGGTQAVVAEDAPPSNPTGLVAYDQPTADPDTGGLGKSVVVAWTYAGDTEAVAATNVWRRDLDDGGPWERIGQARGRESQVTIDDTSTAWVRGTTYEIAVQPETSRGVRRFLTRCRSTRFVYAGYLPSPGAPSGSAMVAVGEQLAYRLRDTYAVDETAHDVEFVRGNFVIGTQIARVPVGDRGSAPSYDFVDLPANSIGIDNPPISVRFVMRDGSVSEVEQFRDLPSTALAEWPARVLGQSYEDGDWSTVGTLSGLSEDTDPLSGLQRLVFSTDPTVSTGTYTGPAHDLASVARWHIGAAAEGYQVHSASPSDIPPGLAGVRRQAWWTVQGPADPRDPLYAPLTYALEIRTSTTSDPTSATWAPHRPGAYTCRSFQLRVVVTRPSIVYDTLVTEAGDALVFEDGNAIAAEFTEHDVRLTRFAVGVRPFPGVDARRSLNPQTTS